MLCSVCQAEQNLLFHIQKELCRHHGVNPMRPEEHPRVLLGEAGDVREHVRTLAGISASSIKLWFGNF
jgi:hypothetical protein